MVGEDGQCRKHDPDYCVRRSIDGQLCNGQWVYLSSVRRLSGLESGRQRRGVAALDGGPATGSLTAPHDGLYLIAGPAPGTAAVSSPALAKAVRQAPSDFAKGALGKLPVSVQ
jgi:hypothetical protein